MNCVKCGTAINTEIENCPQCGEKIVNFSDSVEARLEQAHRMREMQLYSKSISLYQELLKEDGITEHASIYERIGEAYFESGDAHQAIIAFEKALALKPTYDLQEKLFDAKQATNATPIIRKTVVKPEKIVTKKDTPTPVNNKITNSVKQPHHFNLQEFWQSMTSPNRVNHVMVWAIVIMIISITTLVRPWEWFMPKKSLLLKPPRLNSPSATHQRR